MREAALKGIYNLFIHKKRRNFAGRKRKPAFSGFNTSE